MSWKIEWWKKLKQNTIKKKNKKESVNNENAIIETKSTLEGTNSRINETEDRISEAEDRMVEINKTNRKKQMFKNEDNLKDFLDNVKCPNI